LTATGNLIQYEFIREMTEKLIKYRIPNEIILQLGSSWVPSFFHHHRHFKMKMTHAIEATRIKDITKDQIFHFNEEFRYIIREYNIRLEDIFNFNETGFQLLCSLLIVGCSIGTTQTSNVVIDISISDAYEA